MSVIREAMFPLSGEWRNWEVRLIGFLTLLYVIVQVHAIHSDGFRAQDFFTHKTWIHQAASEGAKFLTAYGANRTNPPLYHYLGGLLLRLIPDYFLVALAYCNLALSLIGAVATYQIVCSLIVDRWLRTAAFGAFILLPCFVIQSVAIAADALTTPAFLVFVWGMILIARAKQHQVFVAGCVLASVALLIGVMVKFTFLSEVLVALVFTALIGSRGILTKRQVAIALAAVVLPAAITGWWQLGLYKTQSKYNLGIVTEPGLGQILERMNNAPMNLRSVAFPRAIDIKLLDAPQYNEVENGQWTLLQPNKFSFPGLLHMGAFSDLLNAYQFDPYHTYFGLRTPFAQAAMAVAVKSGLWITILSVIGIRFLTFVSVRSILRNSELDPVLLAVVLAALAWYLNIALFLPLVGSPYGGGYWHPRLVTPAIILFIISGFYWIQRQTFFGGKIGPVLLGLVLLQTGLHASFLWPRPGNVSDYIDSNRDLPRNPPAFGVEYLMSYGLEGRPDAPFFWLGDQMAFVIRRNDPEIPVQSYVLSFTVSPGPANPDPARRVAIHLPDGSTKEYSFVVPETISVPLKLGQGRSMVSVEILEPAERVVVRPADARNFMVNVSGIKWQDQASISMSHRPPFLYVHGNVGVEGTPDSFRYVLKDSMEIWVESRDVSLPQTDCELGLQVISPAPQSGKGEIAVIADGPAAAPQTFALNREETELRIPVKIKPGVSKFTLRQNGTAAGGSPLYVRRIRLSLLSEKERSAVEPIQDGGPFPRKPIMTVSNPQGEDHGAGQSTWYWIGAPATIAIEKRDRPDVKTGYRLQFRLDAGPGHAPPHRSVVLELPSGGTVPIEFDGSKNADIPITLEMGKQQFRLALRDPAKQTVPFPSDPRTLLLRLADVKLVEPSVGAKP